MPWSDKEIEPNPDRQISEDAGVILEHLRHQVKMWEERLAEVCPDKARKTRDTDYYEALAKEQMIQECIDDLEQLIAKYS